MNKLGLIALFMIYLVGKSISLGQETSPDVFVSKLTEGMEGRTLSLSDLLLMDLLFRIDLVNQSRISAQPSEVREFVLAPAFAWVD